MGKIELYPYIVSVGCENEETANSLANFVNNKNLDLGNCRVHTASCLADHVQLEFDADMFSYSLDKMLNQLKEAYEEYMAEEKNKQKRIFRFESYEEYILGLTKILGLTNAEKRDFDESMYDTKLVANAIPFTYNGEFIYKGELTFDDTDFSLPLERIKDMSTKPYVFFFPKEYIKIGDEVEKHYTELSFIEKLYFSSATLSLEEYRLLHEFRIGIGDGIVDREGKLVEFYSEAYEVYQSLIPYRKYITHEYLVDFSFGVD